MSALSKYRKHLQQIEEAISQTEQLLCLLRTRKETHEEILLRSASTDEPYRLVSESYKLLQLRRLQILDKVESAALS